MRTVSIYLRGIWQLEGVAGEKETISAKIKIIYNHYKFQEHAVQIPAINKQPLSVS